MHIVILVYSILSSLTSKFSMSLSDCDVLLVSGNYISYSGYVAPMDDTLRLFKMTQSLQALRKYDRCLRLQFITPLSTYKMIFQPNVQHWNSFGWCIAVCEENAYVDGWCPWCHGRILGWNSVSPFVPTSSSDMGNSCTILPRNGGLATHHS